MFPGRRDCWASPAMSSVIVCAERVNRKQWEIPPVFSSCLGFFPIRFALRLAHYPILVIVPQYLKHNCRAWHERCIAWVTIMSLRLLASRYLAIAGMAIVAGSGIAQGAEKAAAEQAKTATDQSKKTSRETQIEEANRL